MRSVVLALGMLAWVSLANAQPVVPPGSVVNSGSYSAQGVAPGSLVSIFGTELAASTSVGSTIPLSTTLSDVMSVSFSGIPAGLYFVSAGQINAQLPFNVLPTGQTSGAVNLVVTRGNGASAPSSVTVVPASPGIFTTNAGALARHLRTTTAPAISPRRSARPLDPSPRSPSRPARDTP